MLKLELLSDRRPAGSVAQRLAEFAQRGRKRALAETPQRLAIIRALLGSVEHARAEAIYRRVRKRHPHISLATVHRTLETLCESGEARKVTMLHDRARHDGNLIARHHVVCIRCRRIRDLEIPGIDRLLDGHSALGEFKLLRSALEIQGLCGRCGSRQATRGKRARGRSFKDLGRNTSSDRNGSEVRSRGKRKWQF